MRLLNLKYDVHFDEYAHTKDLIGYWQKASSVCKALLYVFPAPPPSRLTEGCDRKAFRSWGCDNRMMTVLRDGNWLEEARAEVTRIFGNIGKSHWPSEIAPIGAKLRLPEDASSMV